MLDKELELTLNAAFKEARELRYEFMTVEHLALALLDNPAATQVLQACGGDTNLLRQELSKFIASNTPHLADDDPRDTQPTLGFQRVLQRAVFQVQSSGRQEMSGANVLVAIFGEQESHAVYLLTKNNISRLDILNFISHGIPKIENGENPGSDGFGANQLESDELEESTKVSPLEQYAVNLNVLALAGKIDPLIGREHEIDRTIQILCRRRKNNPLLVGEAGVGKTAIAEGLAKKIVDDEVPEVLSNTTIFSLDLGALVAGTKYRGDFEKRLKSIIKQLQEQDDVVLFIDEIHTIIGAGAASGGVMDASNLIKPVLASGDMKCIGSTTYQEFRGIFEKDRALARRFQKVDVSEPSVEETISILKGLKPSFEEFHAVKYTNAALKVAVELSEQYINDRFLPDKAIDIIDEAGARRKTQSTGSARKKTIGIHDIESIVAKIARIPEKTVSSDDLTKLKNLERDLQTLIFGQDDAIETLTTAIKMSRAGLSDEKKPIGSFLVAGPTGVGKTEVTKQLANMMGVSLLRFDMSEYMERHTVSRLIGAPPGYVGYDQGGLLTDAVIQNPHAVLLLDEIEKAHPDVFNLLLQVMDHGTLTDNNGRKASFRNVIIIMTTNAGAESISRRSIGFANQDHSTDGLEAINRFFSPEFRNRLDAIIQFNPLDQKHIHKIVSKFIIELESLLEEKGVSLTVTPAAYDWLSENGFDAQMGARPMARIIQDSIKKPLANELLFGKLTKCGHVTIDQDRTTGKLSFKMTKQVAEIAEQ